MSAIRSKLGLIRAGFAASALLLAGAAAQAQSAVTLTAYPTTTTLPDGQTVPMWGYRCDAATGAGVSCTAMNGAVQSTTVWQPPLIKVPSGQTLTITLRNALGAAVSTSIVIDGQVGGGLGDITQRTTTDPIVHPSYGATWPASGDNSDPGATFTPPAQLPRVKSLATEVLTTDAAGKALVWSSLRPGTYLLHSGTHPSIQHPMGLYGMLVVTDGAYPGVTVDQQDVPLLLSEIDPVQNQAVATAVATTGFSEAATYSRRLADGVNSVLVSNGGSGYAPVSPPAVTLGAPPCTINGTTCVQATATAVVTGDAVSAVNVVNPGAGYLDAPSVSFIGGGGTGAAATSGLLLATTSTCIDASRNPVAACYPPAVAYDPRYYLVNGVSFDRTHIAASTFAGPGAGSSATGRMLLRFVNAGLRMHVPQVVGQNMSLLAEDGNILPGVPKVQTQVFLAAGKTYDVAISPAAAGVAYPAANIPVYDRQLSLSTNNQRDGGMQAYIAVGGGAATAGVGSTASAATAVANADTYYLVPGKVIAVAEPAKGLLGNDKGVYGATLLAAPTGGTVALNSDGTFTYTPTAVTTKDSFTYCANGTVTVTTTGTTCSSGITAQVTLAACTGACLGPAPTAANDAYTSNLGTRIQVNLPGVLGNDSDPSGLPLKAVIASAGNCGTGLSLNADGSFTAARPTGVSNCTFTYNAVNSQNTPSSTPASVTLNFPTATGLKVNVVDAVDPTQAVTDYRWIIEEDRTFWVDPKCQINSTDPAVRPTTCPALPVESLGYNFHTASMPVVAQGCVGAVSCEDKQTLLGRPAVCDVGNGVCRTTATQKTQTLPSEVYLDPAKRYYISILPGDGVNPVIGGAGGPQTINGKDVPFDITRDCGAYKGPTGAWEPGGSSALCGHAMGGSQVSKELLTAATAGAPPAVTIKLQETPLPTAKIAVFVFQDDNPLNGENDAGGGIDILAPNEAGLGGFEVKLFDQAGGLGDATGQITYDMFNMPVSNALAGTIDPTSGQNACPITKKSDGIVGMIPTCPKYMADGVTLSPLAGQALIANLYPGLYEIVATPGTDRIARGEEWLQTNTLDGGKAHEAFIKPNEPGYFQEFGPGGFHVSIGFANPKIINDRRSNSAGTGICDPKPNGGGLDCSASLTAQVTNTHMSRTPDQRMYSSGDYSHYGFTNCYLAIGPADGADFALEKCDQDGKVTFSNIPSGSFKLTVFDQWNDIMLDGLVSPVTVNGATGTTANPVVFPVTQWRTNLYTRTYIDQNGDGVSQPEEPGLPLVSTNIRYRDGSFGFFNNTDLNGYAGFNEVFPFMNWLVVEPQTTRFKFTGVHTVVDTGGPVDGTVGGGNSTIAAGLANTIEPLNTSLPEALRVPGAVYCDNADCTGFSIANGKYYLPTGGSSGATPTATTPISSGRIDPPWAVTQGWQGLLGQNTFVEWGMKPFAEGENGGIQGHVIYASTRPFDDPQLLLQLSWEPGIPRVKLNLYQEGTAPDGTMSLKLVDTTTSSSWDDWAQGFRSDGIPNMNCPGQDATSPFFQTLKDSKQWLDPTNPKRALPNNSQFKCYDGWSQLNQIQPAPYDGMYKFPSVTGINPANGRPAGTNCTGCATNPVDGLPMLPPGKYVVEVIVPSGYELVKEEDKNILLGDVYVAPVSQQFAGLGNVFIMPDQATVNSATGNPNNPLNQTKSIGADPRHEGDTGSVETFWPCVGAERIVPDYNSLFPGAGQNAPFAGATRRLCDRKEVTLGDEMTALAKFYLFSSTHVAGHFTGTMTNDFASEFDPFSPQFGEKFGPPNLPVGLRDFSGAEVARVYADQWGIYNGLYFSTYGVNPPNPTGYVPQMAIACMNDPGPIPDPSHPGQMITDPAYNPAYSNFCYETPFMPGFTAYMDTPVIPTMAFAEGYNLPDCDYPDATPAIKKVVNTTDTAHPGPWVSSGTSTPAAVSFTLSNVTAGSLIPPVAGDRITSVRVGPAPGVELLTRVAGNPVPIICDPIVCALTPNHETYFATLVAVSINLANTGYLATASGATVTVTGPAASGVTLNGTALTVVNTGVTVAPASLLFAGGAAGTPPQMSLTITALGDKVVQNPAFSGPNATKAPFNQKTITRHYGFGAYTAGSNCGTATAAGSCVTVGGVAATVTGWTDDQINITVPGGVPLCSASNVSYTGANAGARCGELVITAANGKQSIDAITVTVDGKAPWVVTPSSVTPPSSTTTVTDYGPAFGRLTANPLQSAIDNAAPGDLILVGPDATGNGTFRENLLMWKPVRLQGVGAASVTINADAHPAGKMDAWRRQVNCLFGLSLDGRPLKGDGSVTSTYDPTGTYSCPGTMQQQVDRIPFEGILGWDTTVNGNLAQLLQEPTLMGAYEGAGVTALGKGVAIPALSNDYFGAANSGGYPDGYRWLNNTTDCQNRSIEALPGGVGRDYASSNFLCNPSRIDGISVINSSQGGGAIFLHAWNHLMEISNNRISANHGTLTGGITVGTGEFPDQFIVGGDTPPPYPTFLLNSGAQLAAIGLSLNSDASGIGTGDPLGNGEQAGYGFQRLVNVHHNSVTANASIGDALFSGTPSGAGGVTFCVGSDYYKFNHNWICGNLSTGDGAGVVHSGFTNGGTMANNAILFNQSINPTLPTNGGGLAVIAASPDKSIQAPGNVATECGAVTDTDCPPGLAEGTGRNLLIDANLIVGNSAESGSGGGIRLQGVNGSEVGVVTYLDATGTTQTTTLPASKWYSATLTNNVIANNVAGWDGGGVSIQDSLKVSFVNNTVVSNDTTASAGTLFKTIGSAFASVPPPNCNPGASADASCYGPDAPNAKQPAGFVTMQHSPNLQAAMTPLASSACPAGYTAGSCKTVSLPVLKNDLFWQNRAFNLVLGGFGPGIQNQQHLVTLTPALDQQATGECPGGASYWDIGVRGDTSRTGGNSLGGVRLAPANSILTFLDGYASTGNTANKAPADAGLVSQYCNGSRVPPENGGKGYNAPAGRSETTGLSPVFTLSGITPAATVDEGQNWINLSYGPLTMYSATVQAMVAGRALGTLDGVYSIRPASSATSGGAAGTGVPAADFFGNPRPSTGTIHIGAVQLPSTSGTGASLVLTPATLGFPDTARGGTAVTLTLTLENNGGATANGISIAVATIATTPSTGSFTRATGGAGACGTSLAANSTCTISVTFTPPPSATGAIGEATGTVTVTATGTTVVNSPATLSATVVAALVPDLAITKSHNVASGVSRGSTVTYSVVVQNVGQTTVTTAPVTDTLPGATYLTVASANGGWTCTTSGTGNSCTAGGSGNATRTGTVTLVPGGLATFTLTGTVAATAPAGTFTNTACVATSACAADQTVPTASTVSGELNLANNKTWDYVTVLVPNAALTGNGAFGSQLVNTTSSVHTFAYTNTGNTEIAVNNVTVTGDYAIAANHCVDLGAGIPLAVGASCTIDVTFTPTATGNRTSTLTVSTVGTAVPNRTASLTGTGAVPVSFTGQSGPAGASLNGSGTTLAFGDQSGAQTDTVTLTLGGAVTIGTATVTNLSGSEFSKGADTCSGHSFTAGQTCTIVVNFNAPATSNSNRAGTLNVPYTGGSGSPAKLSLTGR